MFKKIQQYLQHEIGIDLGTTNTLVYLKGQGIVINEPSVVALNKKTGQIVAVGARAKEMLGRTPGHIEAVRPLVDGVVSNYEVTEEMVAYLLNQAQSQVGNRLLGPRVVVGVPSGITNVERRAVRDAARGAGARSVHIVEEPMAAACGIRLPIHDPVGHMVVDVGGGTSDIAIVSLGGLVRSANIAIAGDQFDRDIISYVREEFKVLIGESTAEKIKLEVGSITDPEEAVEIAVHGRDLVTGLPREIVLDDDDVREAVAGSVDTLVQTVTRMLEEAPPEIVSDITQGGIYLVGGGAHITGLAELFAELLEIPTHVPDEPLLAVAHGTGAILDDLERFSPILVTDEDELTITPNQN